MNHEHIALAEDLKKEQEFIKLISSLTDDAFFDCDLREKRMRYSRNFAEKFELPEILDNYPASLLETGVVASDSVDLYANRFYSAAGGVSNEEIHLITPGGDDVWYLCHYNVIYEDGLPVRAIGKMTDITRQKQHLDQLTERAERDPLTKLYNKGEARLRIEKSLVSDKMDERFALMIIDIDNFKGVNDNLGHQFGDTVLAEVAHKIKILFRDSDVVGRIGGDEFVVFMRNVTDDKIVKKKAEALCEAFRHTYSGEKNDYKISGSIGIATTPECGSSFEELYHFADIALYESKHKGKDRYTFYHEDIEHQISVPVTAAEATERFVANFYADDIIYNIFQMLYETKDIRTTINMILEIIGKKFGADRCYIFEHDLKSGTSSNTYEWCAPGVEAEIHTLQNFPMSDLDCIISLYNAEGIFYCNDIESLDTVSYDTLNRQGIQSVLHCAIYDDGVNKGFIGFDDCQRRRIWRGEEIATFGYISRILSTFILKKQISNELMDTYSRYMEMLDNLNGYVYVMDTNTHETLYLNNLIKSAGFEVGTKCHKIFFDRDTPCDFCPAKQLNKHTKMVSADFHIDLLKGWGNAAVSKINWIKGRDTALFCCTDISRYKK